MSISDRGSSRIDGLAVSETPRADISYFPLGGEYHEPHFLGNEALFLHGSKAEDERQYKRHL